MKKTSLRVFIQGRSFPKDYSKEEKEKIRKSLTSKYPHIFQEVNEE